MQHRLFFHDHNLGFFARGEIPSVICFVPLAAFNDGVFHQGIYAQLKYNTTNVRINPSASGSHTFPSEKRINEVLPSNQIDAFVKWVGEYYGDVFTEQK